MQGAHSDQERIGASCRTGSGGGLTRRQSIAQCGASFYQASRKMSLENTQADGVYLLSNEVIAVSLYDTELLVVICS